MQLFKKQKKEVAQPNWPVFKIGWKFWFGKRYLIYFQKVIVNQKLIGLIDLNLCFFIKCVPVCNPLKCLCVRRKFRRRKKNIQNSEIGRKYFFELSKARIIQMFFNLPQDEGLQMRISGEYLAKQQKDLFFVNHFSLLTKRECERNITLTKTGKVPWPLPTWSCEAKNFPKIQQCPKVWKNGGHPSALSIVALGFQLQEREGKETSKCMGGNLWKFLRSSRIATSPLTCLGN